MAVALDWIESYLDYTAAQESPEIFHRWAAITAIGAVLNRRVFLPRIDKTGAQHYVSFPGQISPIFVAGSGKARKSTAINIAKSVMKEVGVNIYDGKITPEQLLAKLSSMPGKQAILCAVASELSAFLGKQSYNDGLIDILIKLADCESHPYETRKKTFDLSDSNVCFTLFGGSTPIGLSKAIPPQAQEHGFLSRYIWVYSEKSGKREHLGRSQEDIDPQELAQTVAKKRSLIIRLREMTKLNGRFRWSKDAQTWWANAYNDYMDSPASDGEGWPTRRFDHLARVAMILNVSSGNTTLTFTQTDFVRADHLITEIETNMNKCFAFIGQHINAEQQNRILNVLRGQQSVKDSDLYYKIVRFFRDPSELRSQLELLKQAGIIGSVSNGSATVWTMLREPF
jgi:hypothetical protein